MTRTLEDVSVQTTRRRGIRDRMTSSGARKWYFGSVWGLAYLAIPVVMGWVSAPFTWPVIMTTGLLLLIGLIYIVLPPLVWGRGWPVAAGAFLLFFALTCLAFPLMGVAAVWLWIYIPIMASMSWLPRLFSLLTIVLVAAAQTLVLSALGDLASNWYVVALTCSISVMIYAFSLQIQAVERLRAAQGEIARLAVVDERERFARDLHDVLGHSLTVVTVKSELARRLVPDQPDAAAHEIEDIERMSRAALVDLRAALAGYREMSLPTELAAAQAALTAADIMPHLPDGADVVDPALHELFAWALRESITNVVRHSGADNCWVALERRAIRIGDDGRGGVHWNATGGVGAAAVGAAPGAGGGSGLAGLAVRASKAGATLTVTEGEDGGTVVTVSGVRAPGAGVLGEHS